MEEIDSLFEEVKDLQENLKDKCVEFIKANIGDRLVFKDTFSEYVEGTVYLRADVVSDRIISVINGDELKIEFEDYGVCRLVTQDVTTYYCLANAVDYAIHNN